MGVFAGFVTAACVWVTMAQQESAELIPLEPLDEVFVPGERTQIPPQAPRPEPAPLPPETPRYAPGTELRITASSLALRRSPSATGPLIRYIPKNHRVTVLQDAIAPVSMVIGGAQGQWAYVQHEQFKGYIFDAYVDVAPPPLDQVLDWVCVPGVRVGPIDRSTTYEDLERLFGEENLSDAEIGLGEGESEPGTSLFAGTEKELVIQWDIFKKTPLAVIVVGPNWHTPKGIAVGTRVSSLVALNEGHFTFTGLEWDFGGQVTDWQSGALERDHALREQVTLTLSARRPYASTDYEAILGDQEFSSDHPSASRVNLRVSSMTVMLNPPVNY